MRDPASISDLEDHVGYWLRFVSNHVSHAFRTKVEAKGVTVAEWVVLRRLLDLGEINPSQLAKSLGMTRGAISKLIDRLREKKLVKRVEAPGDRRYQSISLTPAGRKLVPTLAALADANDAEFFGHLDERSRAQLMSLLRELARRNELRTLPID